MICLVPQSLTVLGARETALAAQHSAAKSQRNMISFTHWANGVGLEDQSLYATCPSCCMPLLRQGLGRRTEMR